MTTNIQLEQMARKNNINLDYVVYKDEMSQLPCVKGVSVILNMSSVGHPGTHWCSLYVTNDKVYYFDSFGAVPPEEVVIWSSKPIVYNDYQIQHFSSEMCGQHSLGFLGLMQGKYVKALLDDNIRTN